MLVDHKTNCFWGLRAEFGDRKREAFLAKALSGHYATPANMLACETGKTKGECGGIHTPDLFAPLSNGQERQSLTVNCVTT
jgi:hypothetical protein